MRQEGLSSPRRKSALLGIALASSLGGAAYADSPACRVQKEKISNLQSTAALLKRECPQKTKFKQVRDARGNILQVVDLKNDSCWRRAQATGVAAEMEKGVYSTMGCTEVIASNQK